MKLKDVLGEELYALVSEKIDAVNAAETDKTRHVRFVDLSEGLYVSRNKFDDTVSGLRQQVSDLEGQATKRDEDLTALRDQLTAAQADTGKLTEAQATIASLQSKYEQDRQDWAQKTAQQAYEFAVKTETGKLKFSSTAAQKEFLRGAIAAGFKMDGDTLLGFSDYVTKYKEEDPTAFSDEKPGTQVPPAGQPTIVLPKNNPTTPDKGSFGFHFNGVRPTPKE